METLVMEVPKREVKNLLGSKEAYLSMKSVWAKAKDKTAAHHLMYNLLCGSNPERGFTRATNKYKVNNGYRYSFTVARNIASWNTSFFKEPDCKAWDGRTFKDHANEFLLPFGPSVTFEIALLALSKLT